MEKSEILDKLRGGDLRSIGKADEVVSDLISEPTLFGEVFRGMKSDNPLVRMRAADVIEKVLENFLSWLENSKSKIVKVNSLEALVHIGSNDKKYRNKIAKILEEVIETGSPAIVARGKKLIGKLKKS